MRYLEQMISDRKYTILLVKYRIPILRTRGFHTLAVQMCGQGGGAM
jgi:hypothetical protein